MPARKSVQGNGWRKTLISKIDMDVIEIVSDNEIDAVWGNANFGNNNDRRFIVKHALLKCASGYYTGRTAKNIIIELGLATVQWELTSKGRQYLFAAFSNGISI